MKTWNAKPHEVERRWYVVDAEGETLGRLATRIADTLRGKRKPALHAPRRHRRLRRRRQRREDRRDRQEARAEAATTATPATRAACGRARWPSSSSAGPPRSFGTRSRACSRGTSSAAPRSASSRSTQAPSIPTRPSSPSRFRAERRSEERVSEIAQYRGTGKRKTSVARVILRPGDGATWINGRSLEEYFPRESLRMVGAPRRSAWPASRARFDLRARLDGGGIAGQAGALRHGIARALVEADPNLRVPLKREGFLTRDARAGRAQEGRPEEGPQAAAVLEALAPRGLAVRERHERGAHAPAHARFRCSRGRHQPASAARLRPAGSRSTRPSTVSAP